MGALIFVVGALIFVVGALIFMVGALFLQNRKTTTTTMNTKHLVNHVFPWGVVAVSECQLPSEWVTESASYTARSEHGEHSHEVASITGSGMSSDDLEALTNGFLFGGLTGDTVSSGSALLFNVETCYGKWRCLVNMFDPLDRQRVERIALSA